MTPEILHLLDRLKPDKVKQARLLIDHLNGHRLLPSTEHELQQIEKCTQKEYRKQQAAAKAAANMAAIQQAEADKAALEAALATHLAHTTRVATLTTGATQEQADDEAEKAVAEAIGGPHPTQMTT